MSNVEITATADLTVRVDAERWARANGVPVDQAAAALARVMREEVFANLASLIPGLEEADGSLEVLPIKWIASADIPVSGKGFTGD